MDYKQEIILKFEKLVSKEVESLESTTADDYEKLLRLDTLYKIHQYLYNFDELEPVLTKYFEDKKRRDKER